MTEGTRRTGRPASAPAITGATVRTPASHITPRQLAYWRRSGLVRPGRGELTQARAVAALRRAGLSPRQIRRAAERLRLLTGSDSAAGGLSGASPASAASPAAGRPGTLRFAVYGQELFVQRAGGAWEGDRAPGQLILDGVVPLVLVDGVAVGPLPGGIPPSAAAPRAGSGSATAPPRTPPRAGPAGVSGRDQIRLFLDRQRDLDRPDH
ncbi:hypothetical protein CC117_00365 [Parafrankia colletiae]|uniref:Uncharacterized protein n=1 Tax=Parafrankia colletiae TaxID=573497 RepID=A0A1S1RK99_9ACTN|nr:hypothetical protein [Parafrankia colletiae]MCK9902464.1 hypothetical protein [Frankia sp. Cpl3]OHV46487.1 hypothetical protein CC117_00365 [Parafrankia colletiae]